MSDAVLICHPQTPTPHVRSVSARLERSGAHLLTLRYQLVGDLSRVRIPQARGCTREDGLWQHTCFELFLKAGASEEYSEWNFSPSSQWASYRFLGYRLGMTDNAVRHPPRMSVAQDANRLILEAQVEARLPAANGLVRAAISAVVEDDEGRLSYWALGHPPGKADFHHREGFVLTLEGFGNEAGS